NIMEQGPISPGDYTLDGVIDQDDYNLWSSSFGLTGELSADGNGDGIVDTADYTIWRDQLGNGAEALSGVGVPEPMSAVLFAIGVASILTVIARRKLIICRP